jgi:hypothetical protein
MLDQLFRRKFWINLSLRNRWINLIGGNVGLPFQKQHVGSPFSKIGSYFEEVVQIFELKRVGGAPRGYQFAALVDSTIPTRITLVPHPGGPTLY